ncbi:MAG TPA: putative ABC exporter domain-containing protein [Candidatus Mediterraneibacter pullistercoris]|nr:putative ABC exporter domain-containing protein [Candidatus Mediterraneibacter pullistercoris]
MKALIYLTKRSFINNMKRAVKKPSTLIALIFGIVYGIFIIVTLGSLAVTVKFDSAYGLIVILTLWSIYMTLGNFMSYSSRKGIIFRPAHAHFVFPAPLSPKAVLLNSAWMNYLISAVIWIVLAIGGFTVFQISFAKVVLLFLTGCVVEIAFEAAVILFLYTNDHLPQKLMNGIRLFIKIFLIAFTLGVILYFRNNGLSLESARALIDAPALQMIPVIGWQIAAYRLIVLGPTTLNIICTVLYLLMVLLSVAGAARMKCDGGYYEEAAKFADDYAELKKRQKNGEMVFGVGGKKRKFRRVSHTIGGKGARAIFYRQLLEYKKERFFFFDKMTVICIVLAVAFSYGLSDEIADPAAGGFLLMGVVAYISLVMSGYLGKWEKELKSPYLFLLPDSPIRKMWYATLMEHIKAFVNGSIICIPTGIFLHVSPVEIIYCILIYTVIQADRLYTAVIAQCLVGEVFGKTGQNVIRMFIQMALLGLGAAAAVLAGIFVNVDFIFPIVLIYSIMVTAAMAVLASLRFDTMEQMV